MSKIIFEWSMPKVSIPSIRTENAVVAVATGERGLALYNRWGHTIKDYARSIGSDFILIAGESVNPKFPWLDKMGIRNVLAYYNRVIYIDSDVEVLGGAPDLFDKVPEECFAAFDERMYYYHDNIEKAIERVVEIREEYEFNFYKPGRYMSTSMMVASQKHSKLFDMPTIPFIRNPCYEQDLIHARVLHYDFPTIYYGPELQYIHGWGGHPKHNTKFHHYPGVL